MREFDCFENINVLLFDLEQYNEDATSLYVTVFANFDGLMLVTNSITVFPDSFCKWDGRRWILRNDYNLEVLKIRACLEMKKQVFDVLEKEEE